MSDQKKSGGSDPFAGLDWDKELDEWDKSASAPGGATVPDSFSSAPPPVVSSEKPADKASAAPARRPLYRPPPVGAGRSQAKPPIAPPPKRPERSLPSLIDDEDAAAHEANTKGGTVSVVDRDEDEDESNRTVVATVSQDLLASLEAAGIKRPPPPPRRPVHEPEAPILTPIAGTPPVDIDLLGLEDEQTDQHDEPEAEDPSVVTSAPDVVHRLRTAGIKALEVKPPEVRKASQDSAKEGEMFDPFKELHSEPAASASLSPLIDGPEDDPFAAGGDPLAAGGDREPSSNRDAPGPKLHAPAQRRHSTEDDTAILDARLLRGAPPPEATEEPAHENRDPFASKDPFAAEDDDDGQLEAAEADENALIDLLGSDELPAGLMISGDEHAEELTGDSLPAVTAPRPSAIPPPDEKPAVEWLGARVEAWKDRAQRMANEARAEEAKHPKARGLVVASEIAAIAGDRALAMELAEEAWNVAPSEPLAVRQLRQLLVTEGRWDDVVPFLEGEVKSNGSPAQKAHSAMLAAEAARISRNAAEEAGKLYETAQRANPADPRPLLARAATALRDKKAPPLMKWPQGQGAEPLAEAITRRAKHGAPVEDLQLSSLGDSFAAIAAVEAKADQKLGLALDDVGRAPDFGAAARWLKLAFEVNHPQRRAPALETTTELAAGRATNEARLAIALDTGDTARALDAARTLAQDHPSAHTITTALAVDALIKDSTTRLGQAALGPVGSEAGIDSLGRALALTALEDPAPSFASTDDLDGAARIALRLVTGGSIDGELRARASGGARLGFTLSDALGSGSPRQVLEALAPLLSEPDPIDDALAKVLVGLAENDLAGALEAARAALAVDPTLVPAVETLLAGQAEDAASAALLAAEGSTDEARGAMLALRVAIAALRVNDLDLAKRAAEIAQTRMPDDGVAPFLAELRARREGDLEGVVEAVRARGHATGDPVARANNLVREVLLLMGSDLSTCIDRAGEAAQLLPKDLTVRALYERIAGEGAQGRAEFRAEMAATLEGASKAEALLDAAREAERHGDLEGAERYAQQAEQAGSGAEATTLRHRVQARGDGAARLAEELLEATKTATEPSSQRELYEALADLDLFARGDAASAMMWHRAILETTPGHLPSLRQLEHMLIREGREDDYEPIASELARVLPIDQRDAHAEVAARLRLRRPGAEWESIADLIHAVGEREKPSLMGMRWLDAISRHRRDDRGTLRATDLLLEHAQRPVEIATLSTRGAEAAFRAGLAERARGYLERALEADPQHPTALASLAELRRHLDDYRGAAETIETMAQAAAVAEHRLEDWHAAAVLWLDRASDPVRGRAALERAAEIDLGYGDVFDRLVSIARDGHENEVIADLYARRLGQIEDLEARAQLQVDYAAVLVELGDRDAARAAIASALDAMPGQLDALQAGVKLAEEAEEWGELERYLSQLADVFEEPSLRVGVWRRLGAVYAGPLPNARGAESVYRKILDETPDDDEILGRLVDVYVELGDGDQAVETHQERVRLATDPVLRRQRLIQLSKLLDEVANEPERALKALEQARASDPADLDALTALAELHGKHGRPEAVAPAMDAAIADLRRRIGEDPGDRHLFQQLARILELRGHEDVAKVVRAALAGLLGEPSPLVGAEDAAAMAEIDPYVCPPELSGDLRALLSKAGEALEKSVPVDLRALKAAKLGTSNPVLKAKIDAVARGFGLPDPDIVISRAMPFLCLPVGSKPFQIIIGDGLCASEDETARRFALARTMKLCGAHCAALIRVPAADLRIYVDALLHHLHLAHPPPAIEAERLDEITKRLQRFIPRKEEPEMKAMAATVVEHGVPSVEALASAAATWGDRVALLAVGDLGAALRGVAWTLGHKDLPLGDEPALRAWLKENPAARDLVAFAVSDAYAEARKRCGV